MNWLLYFFGSGGAFFGGVVFVLLGFAGRIFAKHKVLDRLSVYCVDIGLILVALSAVPLPYYFYATLAAVTIVWLATENSPREFWQQRRPWLRAVVVVVWSLAVAWEAPHHFMPRLRNVAPEHSVYVIGDSITAGLGDKFLNWPKLLAEGDKRGVYDYSRAAATTSTALDQAKKLPARAGVVIVEIGGNDLLGGTSSSDFARHLDALLAKVRERSDTVVMFELPLPPLCNHYGRVQRTLATKHGVQLIPKRVLMGVLASDDATSDSVHLTRSGHETLARVVDEIVP